MKKLSISLYVVVALFSLLTGTGCPNQKQPANAKGWLVEDPRFDGIKEKVEKHDTQFDEIATELNTQGKEIAAVRSSLKGYATQDDFKAVQQEVKGLSTTYVTKAGLLSDLTVALKGASSSDLEALTSQLKSSFPGLSELLGTEGELFDKAIKASVVRILATDDGQKISQTVVSKGFDAESSKKLKDLFNNSDTIIGQFRKVEDLEREVKAIHEAKKAAKDAKTRKDAVTQAKLVTALSKIKDLKASKKTLEDQLKLAQSTPAKLEVYTKELEKTLEGLEVKMKTLERKQLEEIAGLQAQLKEVPRFTIIGTTKEGYRMKGNFPPYRGREFAYNTVGQLWEVRPGGSHNWRHIDRGSKEYADLLAAGLPACP